MGRPVWVEDVGFVVVGYVGAEGGEEGDEGEEESTRGQGGCGRHCLCGSFEVILRVLVDCVGWYWVNREG